MLSCHLVDGWRCGIHEMYHDVVMVFVVGVYSMFIRNVSQCATCVDVGLFTGSP